MRKLLYVVLGFSLFLGCLNLNFEELKTQAPIDCKAPFGETVQVHTISYQNYPKLSNCHLIPLRGWEHEYYAPEFEGTDMFSFQAKGGVNVGENKEHIYCGGLIISRSLERVDANGTILATGKQSLLIKKLELRPIGVITEYNDELKSKYGTNKVNFWQYEVVSVDCELARERKK